jgi:hypothetical protein
MDSWTLHSNGWCSSSQPSLSSSALGWFRSISGAASVLPHLRQPLVAVQRAHLLRQGLSREITVSLLVALDTLRRPELQELPASNWDPAARHFNLSTIQRFNPFNVLTI